MRNKICTYLILNSDPVIFQDYMTDELEKIYENKEAKLIDIKYSISHHPYSDNKIVFSALIIWERPGYS